MTNSFPLPPQQKVREQYIIDRSEKIDNGQGYWSYTKCKIIDTNDGRVVYEYIRNYSGFYNTFEPFRQLKDEVWRDYALISSGLYTFEVVDLQAGKVIATPPKPVVTQELIDRMSAYSDWVEKNPLGSERPASSGFCPTDFRVFDWRDRFTDNSVSATYGKEEKLMYSREDFDEFTGQFALYAGCVWGDDTSFKLRYIDLSKISEGIVTPDERFGYVPLAGALKDIEYFGEEINVAVELSFNLETGKTWEPGINWEKENS